MQLANQRLLADDLRQNNSDLAFAFQNATIGGEAGRAELLKVQGAYETLEEQNALLSSKLEQYADAVDDLSRSKDVQFAQLHHLQELVCRSGLSKCYCSPETLSFLSCKSIHDLRIQQRKRELCGSRHASQSVVYDRCLFEKDLIMRGNYRRSQEPHRRIYKLCT